MRLSLIKTAVFFLLVLILPYGPNAQARAAEAYGKLYYKKNPAAIMLSLARAPGLEAGQFILRLEAKDGISGCAKLSPLSYEVSFSGIYMDVTISDYTVDMRNPGKTTLYGCAFAPQTPAADIPLNISDIKDKGTKRIRFHADGLLEYYDIKYTDSHITLALSPDGPPGPKRYRPLAANGIKDPLTFWFYPQNTLVLYAPAARKDENMGAAIEAFARTKGLTPLQEIYSDFSPPLAPPAFYYYVDSTGFFNGLVIGESGSAVGTLNINRKTGPDVLYLFARRPGRYE